MAARFRNTGLRALRRLRGGKAGDSTQVPGPSPDPSSNIIMTDVATRMGTYVLRRAMERGLLKGRYGKETAKNIVKNRSIGQTLASVMIARFAARSVPGAVIVTGGMAAKVLLDRSRSRRRARGEGDKELLEQARDE